MINSDLNLSLGNDYWAIYADFHFCGAFGSIYGRGRRQYATNENRPPLCDISSAGDAWITVSFFVQSEVSLWVEGDSQLNLAAESRSVPL
jgi:hypothetical protein